MYVCVTGGWAELACSVLHDWIAAARETAERRSVSVIHRFVTDAGTESSHVMGDEGRLRQILYNVFDHTLRRAAPGGVLNATTKVRRQVCGRAGSSAEPPSPGMCV